MPGGVLV
jgi:hypothetical protein